PSLTIISMIGRYLFKVRKRTYTQSNILATWRAAGIHPFNLYQVLPLLSSLLPKHQFFTRSLRTLRTTCMVRSTSKALTLVKGTSERVQKLHSLIQKMDHGLQYSITKKELGNHFHAKF